MSTAAQKALDNEFELDVRVSTVSSGPQPEFAQTSNGCSTDCSRTLSLLSILSSVTSALITRLGCN